MHTTRVHYAYILDVPWFHKRLELIATTLRVYANEFLSFPIIPATLQSARPHVFNPTKNTSEMFRSNRNTILERHHKHAFAENQSMTTSSANESTLNPT